MTEAPRQCWKASAADQFCTYRRRTTGAVSRWVGEQVRETQVLVTGGERGIRTLEGLLTLTPLAGVRLRPLGHLSAPVKSFSFQILESAPGSFRAHVRAAMILKQPGKGKRAAKEALFPGRTRDLSAKVGAHRAADPTQIWPRVSWARALKRAPRTRPKRTRRLAWFRLVARLAVRA